MALIVRNTDIINNTGITLANPTGVAGTYALAKDVVTQTVWYVDGVLWTGAVVTVGPGKDYETPAAAVNAASGDTLFLIYPGITDRENIVIRTPSKRYFRGMGASPEDVTIPACVYFYDSPYGYLRDVNLIFENLVLLGVTNDWTINLNYQSSYLSYITGTMRFNKCDIYGRSCFGASWGLADENTFKVYLSYTRLYATWRHLVYMYLNNFYLDKVSYNGTWTTAYCYDSIPPAQDDKAVDGTEGYGYNYGTSSIITSAEVIQRHDLSWGGGTAQSVTEDGVYTLSDGDSNQILVLNFDGENGSTEYNEEVSGLTPDMNVGCAIDTSWKKFGSGSLKIESFDGGVLYNFPQMTGDYTIHFFFTIPVPDPVPAYVGIEFNLKGVYPIRVASILTYGTDNGGKISSNFFAKDNTGNFGQTGYIDDVFTAGSVHHLALVVKENVLNVFVDGIKSYTVSETIGAVPFSGLSINQMSLLMSTGEETTCVVKIDALEITNEALWTEDFTPPTSAPSVETGNTIEATVDYSALAAEDTTDNVRVTDAVYISITPYMKRISAGQTQQFTATMIDNEGNAVDVTNEVVWASSDTDIATINSSGLATGLAEGDVTISATMS